MPSKLEKQGDYWTFRYRENGIQKRKTIGEAFISKKEAERLQVEFLHNQHSSDKNKVSNISLAAFLNEYLSYAQTNKRPSTYNKDVYTKNNILNLIKKQNLKDITAQDIETYKTQRTREIQSISVNRELETIKAMFNIAVKWKYLKESPAKYVKPIKQAKRAPRYLSKEEIETLLNVASGKYKDMITIALYTGFRIGEVYNLQWQDVDFIKNLISVAPKHNWTPKDYEFRSIPMNASLKEYLLKLRPETAKETDYIISHDQSMNTLLVAYRKLFKKANIEDVTFHTLRHTFASHLVIGGKSLYTVSQLLGHSKIDTTMIYAHLSKEHLKNSVDDLNF
ncbi:MAG: site-specific integrase [Endomicrobia bacterium]|nr:site-specific integrase [Endomicrobiia bacterium]